MTVKKLIEELQKYPENMEVILYNPDADFPNYPLEYVEQKNVRFCEDADNPNKEPYSDVDCVVLSGDNI